MTRLLLIETSTALCSVALAEDGILTACRESTEPRSHAAMTAPLIRDLLGSRGLQVRDCSAICVSKGPGSYTGLRVGVSTAKGLAFGAGLPLIAIGTLELLAAQALAEGLLPAGCRAIVPMIDARRMEVYAAVFSPDGQQLTPTEPRIVDRASYAAPLAEGPVLFIGDGVEKCETALAHPHAHFAPEPPRAASMLVPAQTAWHKRRFEDTAYFEPFYLKDFVATVSRKSLL